MAVNQTSVTTSRRRNLWSGLFLGAFVSCIFVQSLGAQWSPPQPLTGTGSIGSPGGTHPLVADGDTVYAVWCQRGTIRYRRSDDAGRTWTEALSLTSSGKAQYPCSLELAGTTLHLIWTDSRNGGWELYYMRSTDAGKTWEKEVRLTPGIDFFRFGTAICGKDLHIVWSSRTRIEKVPAGTSTWTWTWGDIHHICSHDGGVTWEKPVRLNQKPDTTVRPAVAVFGQFVHVAWCDQKAARQKPGWDIDIYYRRSTDGGATWDPEVRMTNTGKNTRHPQIIATPGNRVCCIWEDGQIFDGAGMVGDPALYAAVSTDNGQTWRKTERITAINAPNGFATHAKAYAFGSRVHLTWQDAPEGQDKPRAVYYMTSADGGLTWQAPERLTEISEENWGTGAVAGTDSWAVVELARESDLWYCRRDLAPRESINASDRAAAPPGHAVYRIRAKTLCVIDPRLFGQFMERPSWGEIGVEAAIVPDTNQLQPAVLQLIRQMEIPIIRFPGGTDVDYLDWRDMVSNVPGRGTDRPVSTGHQGHKVTNHFGYDEFLRLQKDLKSETILVVNLRDALFKRAPLDEHALQAAGLVAYCNAPVGAKLPDGMTDWPAVRANNGHAAPYGVKYWQIGNETWAFFKDLKKLVPDEPEKFYADCVVAIAKAMLSVDPSIEFIIDGDGPTFKAAEQIRKELGQKAPYLVFHLYMPWGIREVTRDGQTVPIETLTAADVWNAWVATPDFDNQGLAVIHHPLLGAARNGGFKVAVTEWNWNGGWSNRGMKDLPPLDSALAKGIGAAGILHAMMRSADVIEIGCQSMLVGDVWGIYAIHADRAGQQPPYYMPTGQVTMFYSQHHGERLLAIDSEHVPTYAQPFKMGGIRPKPTVACIDALATADDGAVFLHLINRHFDQPQQVTVDLTALAPLTGKGRHYLLQGRLNDKPNDGEPVQIGQVTHADVTLRENVLDVLLPPRTVSCVEIARTRAKSELRQKP